MQKNIAEACDMEKMMSESVEILATILAKEYDNKVEGHMKSDTKLNTKRNNENKQMQIYMVVLKAFESILNCYIKRCKKQMNEIVKTADKIQKEKRSLHNNTKQLKTMLHEAHAAIKKQEK